MILTEQHVIKKAHVLYEQLDRICFLSKNLYNACLYDHRQHFFETGKTQTWQTQRVKFVRDNNLDYRALPAKIAGEVVMQAGRSLKSFYALLKKKQQKARLPHYLPKNGRNVVVFPKDAISKKVVQSKGLFTHTLSPKDLAITITSRIEKLLQVRIIPKGNHIVIEVVYEKAGKEPLVDNGRYASIDLGINNFAAIFYNAGDNSQLWNGRHIKSINHYYNKKKAYLQSKLPKGVKTSKRIQALTQKRAQKLDWELHNLSSKIVNQLVSHNISKLIIGHNKSWKQDINIGRRNNQNFCSIPHSRFIQQLTYKAQLQGIEVITTEEAYTSKASFLNKDPIPLFTPETKNSFSGKRIKRGLYRCNTTQINADINGAGNIMRKVVPDNNIYYEGIEAVTIQPVMIKINQKGQVLS